MIWAEYLIMGLGSIAAIALTVLAVLVIVDQIVTRWGRFTFTTATLAEAAHRARYYRWAYEWIKRERPLIEKIEAIVEDDEFSAERRIEEIEWLLGRGRP